MFQCALESVVIMFIPWYFDREQTKIKNLDYVQMFLLCTGLLFRGSHVDNIILVESDQFLCVYSVQRVWEHYSSPSKIFTLFNYCVTKRSKRCTAVPDGGPMPLSCLTCPLWALSPGSYCWCPTKLCTCKQQWGQTGVGGALLSRSSSFLSGLHQLKGCGHGPLILLHHRQQHHLRGENEPVL